jgi:peptidoglycan/LPS O-acetylase OafA/YrhL
VKRIDQLDAVRGLAVLFVLVHNTDIYPSLHLGLIQKNGWMGVDLFFVLSGFLITGTLVKAKNQTGYFKNFYLRRCLRIWPLYYSVLLFAFVILPLLRPAEVIDIFGPRSGPWWSYPVFLQNYLVRVPTGATGVLSVTWSLGVEEQFYLVWPLVVRLCNEGQLRKIAIGVICISPAFRYFAFLHGINIYSNPFCRLDGLMAGSLLAILVRARDFVPPRFLTLAWITLVVMVPLAVLIDTLNARWLTFSAVVLASSALVYLALFSRQKLLQALLRNRILVYTGTISYGIYLLEKIPVDGAKAFHLEIFPLLAFPAAVVATYAMAALSWRFLERPFLRLKRFYRSPEISLPSLADESVNIGMH